MVCICERCQSPNRVPAARLDGRAKCGSCKEPLAPLARPYDVPDAATFDELLRDSPLPVVVDFWAPWCGPCRMVAPELKKLAAAEAGRVVIAKVNSDDLGDLAGRFGIRGIPTLIRFDRGRETKRTSGAQSAASFARALGLDHAA